MDDFGRWVQLFVIAMGIGVMAIAIWAKSGLYRLFFGVVTLFAVVFAAYTGSQIHANGWLIAGLIIGGAVSIWATGDCYIRFKLCTQPQSVEGNQPRPGRGANT